MPLLTDLADADRQRSLGALLARTSLAASHNAAHAKNFSRKIVLKPGFHTANTEIQIINFTDATY
ncbi:hypothetical protein ACVWZ4_001351 [Bradyrhizobium sp. USDA 4472]